VRLHVGEIARENRRDHCRLTSIGPVESARLGERETGPFCFREESIETV
jgi:hypothetical protein